MKKVAATFTALFFLGLACGETPTDDDGDDEAPGHKGISGTGNATLSTGETYLGIETSAEVLLEDGTPTEATVTYVSGDVGTCVTEIVDFEGGDGGVWDFEEIVVEGEESIPWCGDATGTWTFGEGDTLVVEVERFNVTEDPGLGEVEVDFEAVLFESIEGGIDPGLDGGALE